MNIGPLPVECSEDTPHAPLIAGQNVVVTLDRERGQLDIANGSKRRCADYHNQQAVQLSK